MNLTDLFKEDNLTFAGAGLGDVAKSAIPMILIGLLNNINNKDKAASLAKALGDHEKNDLDVRTADMEDGKKIVGHIFGQNRDAITQAIAKQNNISASAASDVLGKLAPVVLGKLAKNTQSDRSLEKLRDAALREIRQVEEDKSSPQLGDLLGGMFGEGGGSLGDIFGDLLGGGSSASPKKQQDGGLGDILGDLIGGGGKDTGLLESILGGILKK